MIAVAPLSLPAQAQTTTTPGDTYTTTPRQGVDAVNDDNDFDWGWLGLLGLIGLAGLAGRKNEETVRYREPNEVSSQTTRR
ncbi:WGxxGxxG family protein [Microseira wollei]|uniref:WGxxGxxG-CTERM domain-containing protein n=1 Tax=Microseira wollei NIES-4236 TaxID=2530354 RepID=A0AAV3X4R8_9CYAN|nr:WGxxGxxG family protein [Microseira wollei]GET35591.1 hypothetical protein MiSe_03330 [Microseira wollei NIES-4236]